ncbi:MAG TPA: ThuA domain-containing protein [Solirubrobacter sp.]|nr:ThuA domain-containing protein [Solirubrobacter sp.]
MLASLAVAGALAAPAAADAGKVLVFTGTAGTANPATATAAAALQAAGTAGDYTVDVTSDAAQINAANLAGYRAVVFVNSSGDVLNAEQETALQNYVNDGGGFVGIGETARLEENSAFFDTLIGLTGAPRVAASSAVSTQDVEFLDRVHPATRDLNALVKGRSDNYYQWTNNPTGTVHTVARVRFNTIPVNSTVENPAGTGRESVTNDAITRFTGNTNTLQPQGARALSWCRDIQDGRSFYTGMGQTVDAYDDTLRRHLASAVQWAAGMVRGNCKATITSNYTHTPLTPPNPTVPAQPVSDATANFNPYMSEIDALAMARDGRVFYAGRAVCFAGQQQFTQWTHPTTGLGCGPIHVYDPRGEGSHDRNPARITKIADFTVLGAKGGGAETGNTAKTEHGVLGIALDPQFGVPGANRNFIYVAYHPYYGGTMGRNTGTMLGPGFVRSDYMAERRLSRFTYNETTKTLSDERIIHRYMTQVFSCCHLGGSMDFDSQGNLYFATGDNTGNSPNSTNGGYTNSHPQYTIPCPGDPDPSTYEGTGCGIDTSDPDGDGPLPPREPCAAARAILDNDPDTNAGTGSLAACGYISYSDARQTSGNTNAFEGKLLRIRPVANPPANNPGIGTSYTIPGPDAPNGPNLFAPDSEAVTSGKAKPEIFAMGVRNLYSIDVDDKTDKVAAAWVGPDQGTNSTTWGPAKTENAVIIGSAGNYGWPFCTGNNQGYRAKLPANTGGGAAAPFGHPGTVGGGADGATGGYWDCDDPQGILNQSPFNTGLERIPPARPTNIWYGPQGGCYDFPRNANGIPNVNASNTQGEPQSYRRCPFIIGGSQAPMTAGFYRRPADAPEPKVGEPSAWPAYWDGRWFLADYAGGNNLRHALLMDPDTEFTGGAPLAADSLYPIIPTSLMNNNRMIDLDFGADGMLYVADYGGSNFQINNNNNAVRRFAYIGGPDTPGPDPQVEPNPNPASTTFSFNVGKSGGISYKWEFSDGGTATGANVTHTYVSAGNGVEPTATLTVTYADGQESSATIDVPVPTTVPATVTLDVPETLGLTISGPANFGGFVPGVGNTYAASTTANVISTMPNALLAVVDQSSDNQGFLVNDGTPLASRLRMRATNSANPNTAFNNITGTQLNLLSWSAPISNDAVTLHFQQPIAANEPLKAGGYTKTLTFTLSTTSP